MRTSGVASISIALASIAVACGPSAPTRGPTTAPEIASAPALSRDPASCRATPGAGALRPLGEPGRTGSTVALATLGGRTVALAADEDGRAIVALDVDARKVLATTPLPGAPSQVLVLDDGRVLVGLRDRAAVASFEAAPDGSLLARCAIDVPAEPLALASTVDGRRVAVSSGQGSAFTVLDGSDLQRRRVVPLAREPRAVLFARDGATAFVTHAVGGKVSVVEVEGRGPGGSKDGEGAKGARILTVLSSPAEHQHRGLIERVLAPVESVPGRGGNRLGCQGYALASSSGRVFAPQVLVDPGDPGSRAPGYGDGQVSTEIPNVAVFDEASQSLARRSLEFESLASFRGPMGEEREPACVLPRAAAIDGPSGTLLVTCLGIDAVVAYDARSIAPANVELRRFPVGSGPTGVAVDAAGRRAVVFSQFDRSIDVLSLRDLAAPPPPGQIRPRRGAQVALPPLEDPLGFDVALGRQIFHAVGDGRIARDGRACASCHPDGRDDAITWATPDGPRRTIPLAGRVVGTEPFSWSAQTRDLHAHVEHTFERLDGTGLRSVELDALVAYVRSLPAPPAEARVTARPAPEAAIVARGRAVFESAEAGCGGCHRGGATDGQQHDVRSKAEVDRQGAFDTPSLRNVSARAPYFHDGRFGSLRDLLAKNGDAMGKTSHLSPDELVALEAFLGSL